MEHTGRYYEPMARYSLTLKFCRLANPKLIGDYGNNTLRKVKTDKADSVKINAMLLTTGSVICASIPVWISFAIN